MIGRLNTQENEQRAYKQPIVFSFLHHKFLLREKKMKQS